MTRMTVIQWVIALVLAVVGLKLLVGWLEPRMAFFPTRGVQLTPEAAGLAFADVRIPTTDGETLHAWWVQHPQPRAQVIFFHGNGGNLSMWLDVVVALRRKGLSVLAVDYRGYGDSTGRPSEPGLYLDADAAIRFFAERYRDRGVPLVYWGRSIGAPVAAYAASKNRPDGIVLEAPFPDVAAVMRGNPVMQFLSLFSSYSLPTSRFLAAYDGPLLVVHGDRDSIIAFAAGREVFDRARGARKEFVAIRGADHNDLHVVSPGEYWGAIDRFVDGLREEPNRGAGR